MDKAVFLNKIGLMNDLRSDYNKYCQSIIDDMVGQICDDNNTDYIVSYFHINAPTCEHKILKNGF